MRDFALRYIIKERVTAPPDIGSASARRLGFAFCVRTPRGFREQQGTGQAQFTMQQTTTNPQSDAANAPGEPPQSKVTKVTVASEAMGAEAEPHLVIRPSKGWQALDLRQVWRFRDLLTTLAQRDVKLRYRQTALGAIWVVLQPLMAAGIFSFVFGTVAGLPSGGVPFIVFSYVGLLCWNLFASTLSKSSNVLVANTQLVSKVYFPRLVLPISTVYSSLIDFAVAAMMLVVLMLIYHVVPGWGLLLVPLWTLLTLILAVGCGLFLSALMVSYRDVQYIVPILIPFLLYASPVAYSVSTALEKMGDRVSPEMAVWVNGAFLANPMAGLLEAFRWSVLGGTAPLWGAVIYSAICSVTVFVLGAFAFKRMEKRFADVI